MKTCIDCGETKPTTEFYPNRRKCKLCVRKMQQVYLTPEYQFAAKLKHLYGMTIEDYDAMLKAQGGVCFLCEKPWHRRLWVEHNHLTGEVRGLACGPCNTTLGHLENNPGVLERMQNLLGL